MPCHSVWLTVESIALVPLERHGQCEGDRPLTDHVAVVELIAATTTKTGLKVASALDTRTYQKGIKVTAAQMKSLNIRGDKFHPE